MWHAAAAKRELPAPEGWLEDLLASLVTQNTCDAVTAS
jgi:hypothetical protein